MRVNLTRNPKSGLCNAYEFVPAFLEYHSKLEKKKPVLPPSTPASGKLPIVSQAVSAPETPNACSCTPHSSTFQSISPYEFLHDAHMGDIHDVGTSSFGVETLELGAPVDVGSWLRLVTPKIC